MANRRLQCRQVFWRNGWSTASERAGELRLDSAAPAVAQQRGPARSVGARGGHEGPAQSRALTPRLKSASTLPDCSRTSPAQEVVPDCLRSGTRADRRSVRPSSPSPPPASGGQPPAQLLPRHHRPPGRCGAERRIRARPSVNAHPDVGRARESAAYRRAWRNDRPRSSPRLPRAPDEPSAALEWSLDGTPFRFVVVDHTVRPQSGRSVSRGYPGPA